MKKEKEKKFNKLNIYYIIFSFIIKVKYNS